MPFFGGVYFSAAHPFLPIDPDHPDYVVQYTAVTVVGQGSVSDIDSDVYIPAAFVPIDAPVESTPNYDKSRFVAPADASQRNAFVFFDDQASADKFLNNYVQEINFSGRNSSISNGIYINAPAVGQLAFADLPTLPGDSGGAAFVNEDGQSYVVGVASGEDTGHDIFTYLNTGDYYSAPNEAGSQTTAPPVIIEGYNPNEHIRAGVNHASIITNGDNDVILAGSGGGLINTGTGQNDVVFLPGANGDNDPGTTVVVGPGTTTLVGGGANDKLVLPTDRLLDDDPAIDAGLWCLVYISHCLRAHIAARFFAAYEEVTPVVHWTNRPCKGCHC